MSGEQAPDLGLPKLPVPPIQETMDRYLDSIRAVVSKEEYQNTKNKVDEFLADTALVKDVEKFLQDRQDKLDNWAYAYWLKDMYLSNPLALPVNSNPGWVLKDHQVHGGYDNDLERLLYVAKVADGLLQYKKKFEEDGIEQDYASVRGGPKQPLCMEQYYRVFNTYRLPGVNCDNQDITNGKEAREQEHIIIMRKCRIYVVKVKSGHGEWIDAETLAAILNNIQSKDLKNLDLDERIPLLTAAARDRWAKHREVIVQDSICASTLKLLESCLFIICLDEPSQNDTDTKRSQASLFRQMLHGEGPYKNGANRWYDKTIQLVTCPDGCLGVCYEHSVAEGIAVVSLVTGVIKEADKWWNGQKQEVESALKNVSGMVESLWSWRLSEADFGGCAQNREVKARVMEAADEFKNLCDDTDVEVFRFSDFGKGFVKECKLSPDAFVQMALQLSYHRLFDQLCFTYESASTRRFRQGRVDVIRASHPEALEWIKAMEDGEQDNKKLVDLFKKAVAKQTKLIAENIGGYGLDTPLLGIREACKELRPGVDIGVFSDPVYRSSVQFKLSTSQVPVSLPDSYMGYGAVVPDGYGVSYNLQEDHITFCISSFFSSDETCSLDMANSIRQSLNTMKEMLEKE